jgi:hypothetical protein
VEFVEDPQGGFRMERVDRPVARLAGALRRTGPARTLEEMDEAIAEAAVESMG